MSSSPLSKPDASPPVPSVCTCGYDLDGLPPNAAGKCPACGAATAESRVPGTRFRNWDRLLAVGMIPSVFFIAPLPYYGQRGGRPGLEFLIASSETLGLLTWVTVSAPAFSVLVLRATRARAIARRWLAIAGGLLLSFAANFAAIQGALLLPI